MLYFRPLITAMHICGRQQANSHSEQTQKRSMRHAQSLRISLDPVKEDWSCYQFSIIPRAFCLFFYFLLLLLLLILF